MEINFCEEGVVTISNKTGRITLTEEEIQRLANLVRDLSKNQIDNVWRDYRKKQIERPFYLWYPTIGGWL